MSFKFRGKSSSQRYVADLDYLNQHEDLGFNIKAVAGRGRYDYDDYDSYRVVYYLTTSRPVTKDELYVACLTQFSRGCSCEHDCCGCYFGGPSWVGMRSNRRGTKWSVPVGYSRNY